MSERQRGGRKAEQKWEYRAVVRMGPCDSGGWPQAQCIALTPKGPRISADFARCSIGAFGEFGKGPVATRKLGANVVKALAEIVGKLGDEGWELVSAVPDDDSTSGSYTLCVKRPKS